jgi:hypothetical protein
VYYAVGIGCGPWRRTGIRGAWCVECVEEVGEFVGGCGARGGCEVGIHGLRRVTVACVILVLVDSVEKERTRKGRVFVRSIAKGRRAALMMGAVCVIVEGSVKCRVSS